MNTEENNLAKKHIKNRISVGVGVIVLGILIAVGPQFLFKICEQTGHGATDCFWLGQAELGVGGVVVVLGILCLLSGKTKIRIGLSLALTSDGILSLLFVNLLLQVCEELHMNCRMVTLPALNIISVTLIAVAAINTVYLFKQSGKENCIESQTTLNNI